MRRSAIVAMLGTLVGACGAEVPHGGVAVPGRDAPISRRVDPGELVPEDLDLVVRLDLDRLRSTLGGAAEEQLARRLSRDGIVTRAMTHARALTLGLRVAHLEAGDHVLVLEGDMKNFLPLPEEGFEAQPSNNDKVKVFLQKMRVVRDAPTLIVVLDERAVAFATAAETDAVLRVLAEGADENRGVPSRAGLLSADVRVRRLEAGLERRFPSIARVISQIQRVRGGLDARDDHLILELNVLARSEQGVERVAAFLGALKNGADPSGLSAALEGLEIEPAGATLIVRAKVPAALVLRFLTPPAG